MALHFDSDGHGDDIVIMTGEARLSPGELPADQMPAYLAKYRDRMASVSGSPGDFASEYPIAIRVRPTKVHGF